MIITGDELLPPGEPAREFRIADMNSLMLADLIARDGGHSSIIGPLPDDPERLRKAITEAATTTDAVLISGGSATGPEDHVPGLVAELGTLTVHGLALRPASPTGLGLPARVRVEQGQSHSWRSVARRSDRARPAPTASSSSRPAWKATRSALR